MPLQVLEAGPLATIQDQGRAGYQRYGVPVSGAMDWVALAIANRLVGNPSDAAGIETAAQGLRLAASEPCLAAAAGPGYSLLVQGKRFPGWSCAYVRAGARIELCNDGDGFWGYLAISGGIAVAPVLGSRSTYLRGGFGGLEGRALQAGDALPLGAPLRSDWRHFAGRTWPGPSLPAYGPDAAIEVVLGPQTDRFSPTAIQAFLACSYRVGKDSDRMGYRLEGDPLDEGGQADILSEGVAPGAVQVPADGRPIIMLSDRQTTGGYRKIATVIRAAIPLLAQRPPGSEVRFRETTVEAAQARYRALVHAIEAGPQAFDPDEFWLDGV